MEFYIIEHFNEYNDFISKRIKSHSAIEALSEFYSYLYSINDIGTKCISKADNIEEAIRIFEKLDNAYHIHITNIYTIGNWIYCTEVEDEEAEL